MSSKNGKSLTNGKVATAKSSSSEVPKIPTRRRTKDEIKNVVLHTDPTRDYQATKFGYWGELFVQQLQPWRLMTGRMMEASDSIVNFALNVRNAALMPAEVVVTAKSERVRAWVQEQWDYLWNQHRAKMVSAKGMGFAPLQIKAKEKNGLVVISGLKSFAQEDCRALEQSGRLVGMRVKGTPVVAPQALWLTFNARYGSLYGTGCYRKMYPAWYEKWMDHGAMRLRQLRMIKDAYIGDIFWYPPNMIITLPDGTQIPYRDLMRELGENRLSGGALTLPRLYDGQGKELTGYTPPQDIGGGSQIFEWIDSVDENIMYGADVPMEVAKASDTGSGYSGRSIPFLVVLSVCTQELCEIVQCVDEQILRPLAWLNFGGDPDYEITPRSLVESFSQDTSGSAMGGSAIGSQAGAPPTQVIEQPKGVQFGEEHSGIEVEAYHGSGQHFHHFDVNKGKAEGAAFGPGAYFTPHKETALKWGAAKNRTGNVYLHKVKLKFKHPLDATQPLDHHSAQKLSKHLGREIKHGDLAPLMSLERRHGSVTEGAKAAGFDGVVHWITRGGRDEKNYIATHPHHITHLEHTEHKVQNYNTQHEESIADVLEASPIGDTHYVVRLKDGTHKTIKAKSAKEAIKKARRKGYDSDKVIRQYEESEHTPAHLLKHGPIESHEGHFYHATNEDNLHAIARHGKMIPHRHDHGTDQDSWPDGSRKKRIYFSHNAETTKHFAPEHGKPVLIRTKHPMTGQEKYTKDHYSEKPIHVKHLEYLGHTGKWHPVAHLSSQHEELQFESVSYDTKPGNKLHAPPGGVTIHGVRYEGGEWIPKEVIDNLTPEEQSQVRGGAIARHIKEDSSLSKEHSKGEPNKELFEKAKTDRATRDKVVEMYIPLLHSIAKKNNSQRKFDQDDLVQIGSIALLNAIDTFDPTQSRFITYADHVITNDVRKFMSRKKNKPENIQGDDEDTKIEPITKERPGEEGEQAEAKEGQIKSLLAALNELPEGQKTIIKRHLLEGETLEAIADTLGITKAAAWQREQSGLKALRARPELVQFSEEVGKWENTSFEEQFTEFGKGRDTKHVHETDSDAHYDHVAHTTYGDNEGHHYRFTRYGKEVGTISTKRNGNKQTINYVMVHPEHQRQGHGTRFYRHAHEQAAKVGNTLHISNDRSDSAKALHKHFENKGYLKGTQLSFPSQHEEGGIPFNGDTFPAE